MFKTVICVIRLNPLSQKIILVIRVICGRYIRTIRFNPLLRLIPVICGRDYSTNHLSMVRVSLEKFTPIINVLDTPWLSLVASESPKNCS